MSEMVNVRALALELLLQGEEKGFTGSILKKMLEERHDLSREERAFLTRLTEGTTERKLTLDSLIGRFSNMPVRKLRPVVLQTLRLGIYQILYMDQVPDHAAINEAVKLVKKRGLQQLSGFVNALLRKISGWKKEDREGLFQWIREDPVRAYSTPAWIYAALEKSYGAENAKRILEDQFTPRPLSLRVNSTRAKREAVLESLVRAGVEAEPGRLSSMAIRVKGAESPVHLPGWQEGLFSVQDESSMLAVEAAEIRCGEKILDLCAAPGGKSMYGAELSGSMIFSRDISREKLAKIRENAERLGLMADIAAGDASVFDPAFTDEKGEGIFDLVMADVPCSGLGVLGKKSDIKYRLLEKDPADLRNLGRKILENAERYTRPGGRILFSTCTILPAENKEAIEAFLADHPEWTLQKERQLLQGIDPCDGFYYAVLKKTVS